MNIIGVSGLAGSGKDTVADMLLKYNGVIKVSLADPIKRFAKEMWDFTDEQLWGGSEHRNKPDKRYPRREPDSIDFEDANIFYHLDAAAGNKSSVPKDEYIENIVYNYLTPREVLQHLGTEGARALDYDVWIRYTIKIAKILLEASPREYCYSQKGGLEDFISCYPQGEFETLDNFPDKVTAVIVPDVRFKNEIKYIRQNGGKLLRVVRPGAGLKGDFALHQSEKEMAEIPDAEFDCVILNTGTLYELESSVEEFVSSLGI